MFARGIYVIIYIYVLYYAIYIHIYICIYIIENLYNDSMTQSLEWHDVDEHEHIRKVEGLSGKYLARSVVLHTSVGRRIEFGNCKHAGYIYIYKYNVFSFSLITMETPTILTTLIPRPMKFILAKHTYTCIRVYIYICIYIYMCVCVYIYICVCIVRMISYWDLSTSVGSILSCWQ